MTATAGATGISALHPDVVETHILTRLDGPTLSSASCTSGYVKALSSPDHLWLNICHSTWPSTSTPRVSNIISDGGSRSFFSQSFPLPSQNKKSHPTRPFPPTTELISAVDIYHKGRLILSKVEETETVTGWFRCSPFRIDLLDPKDVVPTQEQHPESEDKCQCLMDDFTLTWILIDPIGGGSVNLSSQKPVSVQRHWLSGEVLVRFASILAVGKRGIVSSSHVQCAVKIICSASEGREMQVREASMEMEDMDGKHLNGKDSLVILQRTMMGKRGTGVRREEEARMRYHEFLTMKKDRKERKLKIEHTLDTLSVAVGVTIFAACCYYFLF